MSDENKVNIEKSAVTILLEIDGVMHLVAMKADRYETVSMLAKASAEHAIKTEVTSRDLRKLLGVDK